MTSRSCKLNALAFSTSGQANVSVTVNGSTVFSGVVPATLTSETPSEEVLGNTENHRHNQMIDFELDPTLTGDVALGISVTEGTLYFTSILANYATEIIKVAAVEIAGKLAWLDVTNNATYASTPYTSDEVFLASRYMPAPTVGAVHKMIYANRSAPLPDRDLATSLLEDYIPLQIDVMENGLVISDNISNAIIDNSAYKRIDDWVNYFGFESDLDKGIPMFKFVIPAGSSFQCTYNLPAHMLVNPNLDLETQVKAQALITHLDPFSDHKIGFDPVFHNN